MMQAFPAYNALKAHHCLVLSYERFFRYPECFHAGIDFFKSRRYQFVDFLWMSVIPRILFCAYPSGLYTGECCVPRLV